MRLTPILILVTFSSCGIIATTKRNNYIESKGIDPRKDTAIINPYQYYIKTKGFVPIYQEISPAQKLDLKVSIQGFENSDSIPIERIFEQMTFTLSDSSAKIENGELYFSRTGSLKMIRIGEKAQDSCKCIASFEFVKNRFRKKNKEDILFFWNIEVLKNGILFAIPSRTYYLQ